MRNKYISEKTTRNIIFQLLLSLNYLHEKGITHRDIKSENILIYRKEPDLVIKLADFGTATFFIKNMPLTDVLGSPYYIAPEVLNGVYDEKCDIWSTGVLAYILLCGKPPFFGKEEDIFFQVKNL